MSFLNKKIVLAAALLSTAVQAANVTLDWNVGWVENVNPDGMMPRRAVGINGQFPPPIINVNQEDQLKINFHNAFGDGRASALHSHGMFFNKTAYWDGAAGVTQCPIPDGQMISYEPLNSPSSPADRQQQWGTFWTHGHYDGQYVDGLRTPSIIHATNETHQYDDDYTIILTDWYHREHADLLKNVFLSPTNPTGAEPVPVSGLVYIAHTPKNGEATYLPGFNENATLPFVPGRTYRLRLINMAALSMYHFWIDGHQMRVIEADGVDTEALDADVVSLAVAQRYSILVTARNDTAQNWEIHSSLDPSMYDKVPDDLKLNITSTISYGQNNPIGVDRPTIDAFTEFNDTALVPIQRQPMVPADVTHVMAFSFDTYSDSQNYASFNNVPYVSPQVPALLTSQTMRLNESSNPAAYGPNGAAYILKAGQMVDLVIQNQDKGSHPIHIHGHQFQIVRKSMDDASDDPVLNPPLVEGQANPMRRDTMQIPAGGSVTVRFRADNTGTWFIHCHIDWHLASGLAAVLIEAPTEVNQIQTPRYIADQCRMGGLPASGNAGGQQSLTDFGTLQAGPKPLTSGWTSNAIGTVVACIISALIGLASIGWYGFSSRGPEGEEED